MVNENIDIEDGLVNGAIGVLKKITYGQIKNEKKPILLWLQFEDKEIGLNARIRLKSSNCSKNLLTPIDLQTQTLNITKRNEIKVIRKQIPLVPEEAIK